MTTTSTSYVRPDREVRHQGARFSQDEQGFVDGLRAVHLQGSQDLQKNSRARLEGLVKAGKIRVLETVELNKRLRRHANVNSRFRFGQVPLLLGFLVSGVLACAYFLDKRYKRAAAAGSVALACLYGVRKAGDTPEARRLAERRDKYQWRYRYFITPGEKEGERPILHRYCRWTFPLGAEKATIQSEPLPLYGNFRDWKQLSPGSSKSPSDGTHFPEPPDPSHLNPVQVSTHPTSDTSPPVLRTPSLPTDQQQQRPTPKPREFQPDEVSRILGYA